LKIHNFQKEEVIDMAAKKKAKKKATKKRK
jgi:hypothetical protein